MALAIICHLLLLTDVSLLGKNLDTNMNKTQVQAISKDKTNIRWKTFIVICGNDYVFISFKVLAVESGVMLSGTFPYVVTMM